MKRTAEAVLVTYLADRLLAQGSWCGETHLQKTVYLAKELEDVPFEFEFILYKHGPFSFDLRDRLTELRADGFLDLVPRPYPYGPTYAPSDQVKRTWPNFPRTLGKYKGCLDHVAKFVGSRGVGELEQIATALHVTRELGDSATKEARVERMLELKPHISNVAAEKAIEAIDMELE